ncbi:sensor histidine kinase [Pseudotabrizicola sp. L79]|uniref:sensor histidine kinase n=1 Tax=Pseudotabrizicola sp. L79 TaxID=3118402 RepID=UPI002F922AE4
MTLMGAALLPLAMLSYVQTLETEAVSDSRARAAILGDTLLAAGPQVDILMRAQGTAATLAATLPQLVGDSEACKRFVRRIATHSEGRYSFVGFIPPSGMITCTSADQPFDTSQSPWLAEMLANPQTRLTVNRRAPISGTSILNLSTPVYGPDQRLLGFASVSMTHSAIEAQGTGQPPGDEDQPLSMMTFDQEGEVLTSSGGMDGVAQFLPTSYRLADFVGQPGTSFLDVTPTGQRRAFAVVPLSKGNLYLLGSWPADRLDAGGFASDLPTVTFPLLMWAASLMVAWLAAESQVLRHVRSLRASITAFAGGDRKVKPLRNDHAALELREVGDAYERMTEAILQDEAQLENTIHQKEVLLREVHHRVKNNLQLIASILNMQLRTTRTAEARMAMKSVQERVVSLATIHRELYQTSGLTDIRADELLPRIVHHIMKIGAAPERPFDLDIRIDDIRLTPDQAVPLGLFLTEGMTNVLNHTWRGQKGPAKVHVGLLRQPDGTAELRIINSLMPRDPGDAAGLEALEPVSDGFGSKLLEAFSSQLDGKIDRGRQGDEYHLTVVFQPSPLQQAEQRQRASDPL